MKFSGEPRVTPWDDEPLKSGDPKPGGIRPGPDTGHTPGDREFITAKALRDSGLTALQSWQHVFSNALQAAREDLDDREQRALAHYVTQRILVELSPYEAKRDLR